MYKVFISHKKTDENGGLTPDYMVARELYHALTGMGISAFFSDKSLEEVGSSQYQDDINTVIEQAEIMVVVASKVEYATSRWVKYEWSNFHGDILSGKKPQHAKLFSIPIGIPISALPLPLRNLESFSPSDLSTACKFIASALGVPATVKKEEPDEKTKFSVITGRSITDSDLLGAIELDKFVYEPQFWVPFESCKMWHTINPDMYIMIKDEERDEVVAYLNISPITDECYDGIKSGKLLAQEITSDMLLSYNMPYPYSLFFCSFVVHPDYQNTPIFSTLMNAMFDKFIELGEREIFIKRMVADAVFAEYEKFCKLFGMKKLHPTEHNSTIYEVKLIPPDFKITSKSVKKLHDFYAKKYEEEPYLFDD